MPLRRLGNWLLDLLYPPRCIGCGAAGHWLCPSCLAGSPVPDRPRVVTVESAPCSFSLPVYSVAVHQGVAREAVHGLKYEGKRVLATPMAQRMRVCCPLTTLSPDVVLAVPLHESRRRERGYNQSDLLARGIAGEAGLESPAGWLTRVRQTPPQVGLSARDRVENVRGAFAAAPGLRGRRALLVDDVCTTGATMAACAAAVVAAGGTVVGGVTFTRARAGADS